MFSIPNESKLAGVNAKTMPKLYSKMARAIHKIAGSPKDKAKVATPATKTCPDVRNPQVSGIARMIAKAEEDLANARAGNYQAISVFDTDSEDEDDNVFESDSDDEDEAVPAPPPSPGAAGPARAKQPFVPETVPPPAGRRVRFSNVQATRVHCAPLARRQQHQAPEPVQPSQQTLIRHAPQVRFHQGPKHVTPQPVQAPRVVPQIARFEGIAEDIFGTQQPSRPKQDASTAQPRTGPQAIFPMTFAVDTPPPHRQRVTIGDDTPAIRRLQDQLLHNYLRNRAIDAARAEQERAVRQKEYAQEQAAFAVWEAQELQRDLAAGRRKNRHLETAEEYMLRCHAEDLLMDSPLEIVRYYTRTMGEAGMRQFFAENSGGLSVEAVLAQCRRQLIEARAQPAADARDTHEQREENTSAHREEAEAEACPDHADQAAPEHTSGKGSVFGDDQREEHTSGRIEALAGSCSDKGQDESDDPEDDDEHSGSSSYHTVAAWHSNISFLDLGPPLCPAEYSEAQLSFMNSRITTDPDAPMLPPPPLLEDVPFTDLQLRARSVASPAHKASPELVEQEKKQEEQQEPRRSRWRRAIRRVLHRT